MHALVVSHVVGCVLAEALHHQGQPENDGLAAGGGERPREKPEDDVFGGVREVVGGLGDEVEGRFWCVEVFGGWRDGGRGGRVVGAGFFDRGEERGGDVVCGGVEGWCGAGHDGCDGVVWR